jgi:hypothetical protein
VKYIGFPAARQFSNFSNLSLLNFGVMTEFTTACIDSIKLSSSCSRRQEDFPWLGHLLTERLIGKAVHLPNDTNA